MDLAELLRPEGVIANLRVVAKKQALQELANRAADLPDLKGRTAERDLFEALLARDPRGGARARAPGPPRRRRRHRDPARQAAAARAAAWPVRQARPADRF